MFWHKYSRNNSVTLLKILKFTSTAPHPSKTIKTEQNKNKTTSYEYTKIVYFRSLTTGQKMSPASVSTQSILSVCAHWEVSKLHWWKLHTGPTLDWIQDSCDVTKSCSYVHELNSVLKVSTKKLPPSPDECEKGLLSSSSFCTAEAKHPREETKCKVDFWDKRGL